MLKNWKSMCPFSNTCLSLATPLCVWNYRLSLGNRQLLLILVKAHSPVGCYFLLFLWYFEFNSSLFLSPIQKHECVLSQFLPVITILWHSILILICHCKWRPSNQLNSSLFSNRVHYIYLLRNDCQPDWFINGPPVYKPVSQFAIRLACFDKCFEVIPFKN